MSGSVTVVTYPATVSVVDSAVTVSVVDQAVTVEAGSSGPQGVAGPIGATGATGATGPKGDTGDTGVVAATSPITYDSGTKTVAFDQSANNTTNDSRYARLGAANAFTVGGHTITNTVAAATPLAITAASGQSATTFLINNSGGTRIFEVGNNGFVVTTSGLRVSSGIVAGGSSSLTNVTNVLYASAATSVGAVIRGAASQTADLFQAQDSAGGILVKMLPGGNVIATDFRSANTEALLGAANSGGRLRMVKATTANSNPGAGVGVLYFRDGTIAGTLKLVVRAGAAGAETTILDNIPQS